MKIKTIIDRVDALRPNTFEESDKVRWLAELDGRIAMEVMLMAPEEVAMLDYQCPEDMQTELLLRLPHDRVYEHWLMAQIDYANGEYGKYDNSMQMFNAYWDDFVAWFANTYEPANGYRKEGYR